MSDPRRRPVDFGLAAGVAASSTGIVISDATQPDQPLAYVNPAFCHLTGYAEAECLGRNCRFLQGPETDLDAVAAIHAAIKDGRSVTQRVLNYRKDGSTFWNELTLNPVMDDSGRLVAFVGVQVDVTAEMLLLYELSEKNEALRYANRLLKAGRAKLERLAYHDPLTGLANRTLFYDRLERALARARRRDENLAILLMDFDGFKAINDQLGHAAGDTVLRAASQRMCDLVRESDTLARLGGDEFVLLMEIGVMVETARQLAERMLNAVQAPYRIGGSEFELGLSIGVSLYPRDGDSAEALIRQADMAMYHVKRMAQGEADCAPRAIGHLAALQD